MFASRSQTGTRLGAVLFLVFSTAACSSTNDSSSIATAGASAANASTAAAASVSAAGEPTTGLTQVEVAGEGFSIGIPEGWTELSAADLEEAGGFDELESANPGVADALEQAQAAIESGQMAFFAADVEPQDASSAFVANVNVINGGPTTDLPPDAAEQMADGVRAQIPVNGEIETDSASLPAGDAAVLRYEWTVAGEDGSSTDVAVTQYALMANGSGYILTFSAPAETLAEYGPIFEQIAESFEAG